MTGETDAAAGDGRARHARATEAEGDTETMSEPGRREIEGDAGHRPSSCPNCGMEPSEWSEPGGYRKEALVYCCAGCAEDTGCVCFHPATRKEAPPPASRRQGAVPGVRGPARAPRRRSPAPPPPAGSEGGTLGDEGGAGETRGRGPRED